jgi:AcrR family transcriptional regulator
VLVWRDSIIGRFLGVIAGGGAVGKLSDDSRSSTPPPPMPNNRAPDVQEVPDRNDPRAERSVAALTRALGELLLVEPFADITVQQILDRAGVARATFYSHFRNKDDVLLESFEGMLARFVARMDDPPHPRGRLVPVQELAEHFAAARPVFASLRASGRLDGIWNLGCDHVAALIEARLAPSVPSEDRRLVARMLAGACMESLRWWMDGPPHPADALDAQFHAFAARLLQTSVRR